MRIDFYLRFSTQFGQKIFINSNLFGSSSSTSAGLLAMSFFNHEFWKASIELEEGATFLQYQYILTSESGEQVKEGEKNRIIHLDKIKNNSVVLIDTWNAVGSIENAFYTTPFKEVFLKNNIKTKTKALKNFTHQFKVKAPLLKSNEVVCLLGNDEELGNWKTSKPILLEKADEWYTVHLDLSATLFPISYKYGVYNIKKNEFIRFEDGDNRTLHADASKDSLTIIHDGFVQLPNNTWKGSGVAIPVFSLRSNNSFGVGEFTDIKLLADWAAQTGLKLIQLLPINDTSATFTNADSYPYAAISAFALHPVYINLQKIAGKKNEKVIKSLQRKQKQLNTLSDIDYEQVMDFKMRMLRELFDLQGNDFSKEDEYHDFFDANQHWLKPYAAFCFLRDKNKTADFNQWKTNNVYSDDVLEKLSAPRSKSLTEIRFYYYVQYHLHLQLKDAVDYAHKKGIVLKGDIPIGIYRNGVDAWTDPEQYHMCWQAGAPPDDFAVKGQNWGFPTYNWHKMQQNHFEWWRQRFEQMSNYFDAFRIDHILGFFRIWSIPLNAVEGILGRFVPALPIHISELGERGIWFDYERYCEPYITDGVVDEIFGVHANFVKESFLKRKDELTYELQEQFNTQRKIDDYFANHSDLEEKNLLRNGLFDLVSNVILFEEEGSSKQHFHFRISIEQTSSFQHFDGATKAKLKELYVDYFYRRQDEFWKKEALSKLPHLKESTDMLICGEDLGMVPHSVPGVMRDLGILSLEIQRMPKDPNIEFFHPKNAPYLSVITPSTHDMSTLRGWWEEDRSRTQKFYNTILEAHGEAPAFCEPWVNRALILQHLYSPAMWSIFQLQDLLGMSETLRRQDPHEERINIPADPNHYWKYRMHLTLEQLIKEKEFSEELKDYITNSGR